MAEDLNADILRRSMEAQLQLMQHYQDCSLAGVQRAVLFDLIADIVTMLGSSYDCVRLQAMDHIQSLAADVRNQAKAEALGVYGPSSITALCKCAAEPCLARAGAFSALAALADCDNAALREAVAAAAGDLVMCGMDGTAATADAVKASALNMLAVLVRSQGTAISHCIDDHQKELFSATFTAWRSPTEPVKVAAALLTRCLLQYDDHSLMSAMVSRFSQWWPQLWEGMQHTSPQLRVYTSYSMALIARYGSRGDVANLNSRCDSVVYIAMARLMIPEENDSVRRNMLWGLGLLLSSPTRDIHEEIALRASELLGLVAPCIAHRNRTVARDASFLLAHLISSNKSQIRAAISEYMPALLRELMAVITWDDWEVHRNVLWVLTLLLNAEQKSWDAAMAEYADTLVTTALTSVYDDEYEVRRNSCWMLSLLMRAGGVFMDLYRPQLDRVISCLLSAMHDSYWDVQRNASWGIIVCADSADPDILEALARQIDPCLTYLEKQMRHTEWQVRRNSVFTISRLAKVRDERILDALAQHMPEIGWALELAKNDDSSQVQNNRRTALEALEATGNALILESLALLRHAASDPNR